jgi:hypothetical protein
MTLDELRGALALLPSGTRLELDRDELLSALGAASPAAPAPVDADQLITAEEAAARLSVSPRWVYDHADVLGVRRMSRRCVRFSARAVERYATRKRASQ